MKQREKDLLRTIESMGNPLRPEFDLHPATTERATVKRGPSKWLEMHDDQNKYGKNFDYRIMDEDVFMPCCEVAQHWLWYALPQELDAFTDLDGWVGYRIPRHLEIVMEAAGRDGLINEADYVKNMNENDNQARQWE